MAETTTRQSYLTTELSSPFTISFEDIDASMDDPRSISLKPRQASGSSFSHSDSRGPIRLTQPNAIINDPAVESCASTMTTLPEETTPSKPSLAVLLSFAALTLSIFLVALDTVIIPTALPTIAPSFRIPDSLYAWVGSAYLLSNAASVPFWGKLSDIFGRKPVILVANAIFLGGSIVCAVSGSAPMLVAGRSVQGLGGGGVVVLVHVCVADMFSIRYELHRFVQPRLTCNIYFPAA